MRVLYVLRIEVDPAVEAEWKVWTLEKHIPDVLAEAGFTRASLYDVESPQGEWPGFVLIYSLDSYEELQRYLASPALVKLRNDVTYKYGAKVRITREVLRQEAVVHPTASPA